MDFNPSNFSISIGYAGSFFESMRLDGGGLSVYNESSGTSVLAGAIKSDGSVNTNMITSGGLLGSQYTALTLRSSYWGVSTAAPAIDLQVFRTSGASNNLSKIAVYNGDDGPIIMQSNGKYTVD